MKTAKKEPSRFDVALSEAARDFAKEMGNMPAGKNNLVRNGEQVQVFTRKKKSVKAGK